MKTESVSTSWRPNETGEYRYDSPEANGSHDYLIPSVRRLTRDTKPGAVVLDFGCGNGAFIAAFRDEGWSLHGVDFSTSGIEQSRSAYPSIEFSVGDVTDETLRHPLLGKCDVIISTEVVEHVMLPRRFARNCFLLLKPGGKLVVSTPYHGYLKNLTLAASNHFDRHFNALWDYGHVKFWSRRTLTYLFEEAGFKVTRFEGSGRLPYLWKSMLLECRKP